MQKVKQFTHSLKIEQEVHFSIGTKFNVVYDSLEKLKAGQTTELPAQIQIYAFLPKEAFQYTVGVHGVWFEEGIYDLKPERFLNEQFPEIELLTVKGILEQAWKKG